MKTQDSKFTPQLQVHQHLPFRQHAPPPESSKSSSTQRARPASVRGPANTQLPARSEGLRTYGPSWMKYGTRGTVSTVQHIARRFHERTGRTMEVGDLSRQGGGRTSRHDSHQRGTDVDVRPQSANGGRTTWHSRGYDREATRELIRAVRAEHPHTTILFNDPQLIREGLTLPWPGHDNHLHLSFR